MIVYLKKCLLAIVLAFNAAAVLAGNADTVSRSNFNIVFIGNSITHGAGLKDWKTEAPPNAACAWLRRQKGIGEVNFANQGYSGHTTIDFLPATATDFPKVEQAAHEFSNQNARLIFSVILGTNDSAIQGPNGAPVSKDDYLANVRTIISQLLKDFPGCIVVVQQPIWYSPNTYNRAKYLQEGLTRLQSYFPEIKQAVKGYRQTNPKQVFRGDTKAFKFFKEHAPLNYQHEHGQQGEFYLHPDKQGAVILGEFWAKAIYSAVRQ